MQELLELNDGNMKQAYFQTAGSQALVCGLISAGDVKLANVYASRTLHIRVDSEAIEDNKAAVFQFQWLWGGLMPNFVQWNLDECRNYFTKLHSLNQLFPDAHSTYPNPFFVMLSKRFMAYIAAAEGDFDTCESYLAGQLERSWLFTIASCMEFFISNYVYPAICLYEHKLSNGDDISIYKNALILIRDQIKRYAVINPGNMRCSGAAYVARICFLLKDRRFADVFQNLEKAYAYAKELACMPVDTMILEAEIARWKGDSTKLKDIHDQCESQGYKYISITLKPIIKALESGELQKVDLDFVPEIVEPILTDEEKLEKLQADLKLAKKEMKAVAVSGSPEEIDAARTLAKAIKVQIKELKAEIAEKAKPTVDQAQIDDIKAKIAEAVIKQEQAFDNDDDEAEDAATEEIKTLREKLQALKSVDSSIPKQKLEDAKKTDAEINK